MTVENKYGLKLSKGMSTVSTTTTNFPNTDFLPTAKMEYHPDFLDQNLRSEIDQYTHPYIAVLREYLSNAIDSLIAAGSLARVIITAPTNASPFLVIEDFGLGMSKHTILHEWSQFGFTTKRNSFEQKGFRGVGAKSALAVADQFFLVSRHDGREITAIIASNESAGSVSVVSDTPTDEPNGVTIRIPMEPTPEILKDLCAALIGYDPKKLDLVNFTHEIDFLKDTPVFYENYYFIVVDSRYSNSPDIFVTVGGDAYKINDGLKGLVNMGVTQEHYPKGYKKSPKRITIDLPIGSVDITPSRDALIYTPRTKETLSRYVSPLVGGVRKLSDGIEAQEPYAMALKAVMDSDLDERFSVMAWHFMSASRITGSGDSYLAEDGNNFSPFIIDPKHVCENDGDEKVICYSHPLGGANSERYLRRSAASSSVCSFLGPSSTCEHREATHGGGSVAYGARDARTVIWGVPDRVTYSELTNRINTLPTTISDRFKELSAQDSPAEPKDFFPEFPELAPAFLRQLRGASPLSESIVCLKESVSGEFLANLKFTSARANIGESRRPGSTFVAIPWSSFVELTKDFAKTKAIKVNQDRRAIKSKTEGVKLPRTQDYLVVRPSSEVEGQPRFETVESANLPLGGIIYEAFGSGRSSQAERTRRFRRLEHYTGATAESWDADLNRFFATRIDRPVILVPTEARRSHLDQSIRFFQGEEYLEKWVSLADIRMAQSKEDLESFEDEGVEKMFIATHLLPPFRSFIDPNILTNAGVSPYRYRQREFLDFIARVKESINSGRTYESVFTGDLEVILNTIVEGQSSGNSALLNDVIRYSNSYAETSQPGSPWDRVSERPAVKALTLLMQMTSLLTLPESGGVDASEYPAAQRRDELVASIIDLVFKEWRAGLVDMKVVAE